MGEHVNLDEIERRAFLAYHQDGLLDIIIGTALLLIGVFVILLPDFWFFLIGFLVVLSSTYTAAKRRITAPRLGYVEFSQKRKKQSSTILLILTIVILCANVATMIAWLIPSFGLILEANFQLIVALIAFLIFLLIGYTTALRRVYVYGIIICLALISSHFWILNFGIPLIVTGSTSLVTGIVLLIRFQKKFPITRGGQVPNG